MPVLLCIVLVFAGLPIFFQYIESLDKTPVRYVLMRNLYFIENILTTGSISSDPTVSKLYEDYLFFPSWKYVFYGDLGNSIDNGFSRSLKSDIGYVRDVWTMGYLFATMYYLPVIIMLYTSLRSYSKMLLVTVLFTIVLFHFKESFYYVRIVLPITVLLWHGLTIKENLKCVEL